MNALSKTAVVFTLVLAMSSFAACDRLQTWLHPSQCALSGRPIHAGMGVRIRVEDGPAVRACCLRCTIVDSQHTGRAIRVLSVTDYVSHEQVSPESAFYVVGSSAKPCAAPRVDVPASRRESSEQTWDRCLPSVIAFARKEVAEKFQQQTGGEIQTFARLTQGTKVTAAE